MSSAKSKPSSLKTWGFFIGISRVLGILQETRSVPKLSKKTPKIPHFLKKFGKSLARMYQNCASENRKEVPTITVWQCPPSLEFHNGLLITEQTLLRLLIRQRAVLFFVLHFYDCQNCCENTLCGAYFGYKLHHSRWFCLPFKETECCK